jgi:hypothetical protein
MGETGRQLRNKAVCAAGGDGPQMARRSCMRQGSGRRTQDSAGAP